MRKLDPPLHRAYRAVIAFDPPLATHLRELAALRSSSVNAVVLELIEASALEALAAERARAPLAGGAA